MLGTARGNPEIGLHPHLPTLPSMMKEAGYHTALIGKWHLGFRPHFGPDKSGYMHHFGPMSGGVSYYGHNARGPDSDLELDGQPYDEPGYLTDLISKRAAQYVRDRTRDKQDFFSVCTTPRRIGHGRRARKKNQSRNRQRHYASRWWQC